MLTLALNPVISNLLVVFFLLICVTMVLVVLIQRPQGGGLSGAFGSGGGSAGAGQTAFGTKTGDVLTWTTVGVFFLYLVLAMVLNFTTRPQVIDAPTAPTLIDPALREEAPADGSELPPLEGEDGDLATPAGAVDAATDAVEDAVTPDGPAQEPEADPADGPATDPASAEQPG